MVLGATVGRLVQQLQRTVPTARHVRHAMVVRQQRQQAQITQQPHHHHHHLNHNRPLSSSTTVRGTSDPSNTTPPGSQLADSPPVSPTATPASSHAAGASLRLGFNAVPPAMVDLSADVLSCLRPARASGGAGGGAAAAAPPAGPSSVVPRGVAERVIQQLEQPFSDTYPSRVLFHGAPGCGKSVCLAHLAHHFHAAGWIVAYVPSALDWVLDAGDLDRSGRSETRLDQNGDAAKWLVSFGHLNEALLSTLPLRGRYEWGARKEVLPEDTTLQQLAQLGSRDQRLAVDVVGVLLKELTSLTPSDGHPRVLIAIDEVNALLEATTPAVNFDLEPIDPRQLSLVRHFAKLVVAERPVANGCLVGATSTGQGRLPEGLNELTRHLLRWRRLPVNEHFFGKKETLGSRHTTRARIEPMSDLEAHALLDWMNQTGQMSRPNSSALIAQLRSLTDLVPRRLVRTCAAL